METLRKATRPGSHRDPKLAEFKKKAAVFAPRMVELLLDKAVRNLEDPVHYPLGPGDSPERKLVNLLGKLSDHQQRRFISQLRVACRPVDRATHYGPLAAVDLSAAAPLGTLIKAGLQGHIPALDSDDLEALSVSTAARGALPNVFRLHVNTVEQVKKTIEAFEGRDEIRLKASLFNQQDLIDGRAANSREFELGKFKRHEAVAVNENFNVDFLKDRGFPQTFLVLLELFEVDRARPDSREATSFGGIFAGVVAIALELLAIVLLIFTTGPGGFIALFSVLQMPFVALAAKSLYEDDAFQPFLIDVTVQNGNSVLAPTACSIQPGETRHGQYKVTVAGELA